MSNDLPTVPGTNEYSMIDFHRQYAKARRKAVGEFGDLKSTVRVEYGVTNDGETYWSLTVNTRGPLGSDRWSRVYETRVDAYAAFEWYLDRHDELTEQMGVTDD